MKLARTFAALTFALLGSTAHAQSYPDKAIRMVVPFAAGGASDILARTVGQKLSESWGKPVVIENRPGAGGTIGTEVVAKAAPDGYTLVMGAPATHSTAAALFPGLSYDPLKDFIPVALVATTPSVLVVNPELPVKSVQDLIALAKAKPGQLTFGSSSSGTSQHLAGELFNSMADVKLVHVSYKGSSAAHPDLLAGRTQLMFDNILPILPHIKSGKVRAIAVTTPKRSSALPDLPTISEAGLPGFDVTSWFGILAPAGTPAAVVTKLNTEINRILTQPEVKEKLASLGAEPGGGSAEEFGARLKRELPKWEKVIRESGAKAE